MESYLNFSKLGVSSLTSMANMYNVTIAPELNSILSDPQAWFAKNKTPDMQVRLDNLMQVVWQVRRDMLDFTLDNRLATVSLQLVQSMTKDLGEKLMNVSSVNMAFQGKMFKQHEANVKALGRRVLDVSKTIQNLLEEMLGPAQMWKIEVPVYTNKL